MKATTTIFALVLFACLSVRGVNEKLRIDELGKVGVGTANPSTKLEVDGALTVGDVGQSESPKAGTIKFDGTDFLGYDGSSWRSLTLGASSGSGGSTSGAASGSLLALPAGDPAPAGYTFVKAMDKALQWEQVASRNHAGHGGSIQALDGKLYYTGAFSINNTNGQYAIQPPEKYDPTTNQWTVFNSPDVPRRYGRSVAHEGKLYFIGGSIESNSSNVVEIYDPQKNFWSRGPKLPFDPTSVSYADIVGAVSSGGKIYLSTNFGEYDLFSLDVAKGIWEENHWANPLSAEEVEVFGNPYITPCGTLLGYQGKVYLFESGQAGSPSWPSVFDPATQQWSWEANMWGGKYSYCYWTYGGRIFQGGGGSISTYDPRTGITEHMAIVGANQPQYDEFSSSSAAILGDYVYVLASASQTPLKELYRASLKNLKDLYHKD